MKPVVFVIGASGTVGKATVTALSLSYAESVDIKAGVRNPEKASDLKSLAGVTVVQAEMGQKEKLKAIFKGVSALFIVSPGVLNRVELTVATAEAAKEADVKHLLVVSGAGTGEQSPDAEIAKQWADIESAVSKLGVPYTFFRLPWFFENYFAFQPTIKEQSAFYGPVDPTKPFTAMAAEDAGTAATAILVSPEKHAGKAYTIISDRHTHDDIARAFTKALGREVKYVRISYEKATASLLKVGVPQWQVDVMMKANKLTDAGSSISNQENIGDFLEITGKKPTDIATWASKVAAAFQ